MKLTLAFGVILILAFIIGGHLHEQVHVSIFESYGIKSEVYYFKYFPSFVTEAEKSCPNDACEISHAMNEAVGYNHISILIILGIGLLIIICLIEERNCLLERR